MLAFTTNDVAKTSDLIENMTIVLQENNFINSRNYLNKVIKIAREEYSKLANPKPVMDFIYAGFDKFSERIKSLDGNKVVEPPIPLIVKQSFPGSITKGIKGYGYIVSGSGKDFETKMKRYYSRLVTLPDSFSNNVKDVSMSKAIALRNLVEKHFVETNSKTVGGFTQIFVISKSQIRPFVYTKNKNGMAIEKTYINSEGNWVVKNLETNKDLTINQNL